MQIDDLFPFIMSPILVLNIKWWRKKAWFIDTSHYALVIYSTFFTVFKKPLVALREHVWKKILYINIYLKKHMEENLSNFMQAQYTSSG